MSLSDSHGLTVTNANELQNLGSPQPRQGIARDAELGFACHYNCDYTIDSDDESWSRTPWKKYE